MLRGVRSCQLALALLVSAPLFGGILPEQLGTARRGDVKIVNSSDPVLEEYGIEEAEEAVYGPMTVTAWRFRDSTGGMAAFQYLRPADGKPDTFDKQAAVAGKVLLTAHGNYVYRFEGTAPTEEQYKQLQFAVPRIEQSPLPVISTYLPAAGLIPNSERYITGPVTLEKFLPGVPPSLVAFHMSAEAQYGRYRTAGGQEMNLTIFSYPTPSLARERSEEMRKLGGAVVKRAGPLVVLTLNPPNADEAEKLLAKVNYQAALTWNENPNRTFAMDTADMILSILKLSGIVIAFCVLSGLGFAGIRMMRRRIGKSDAGEGMITLHLEGK